ncbi:MAG: TonB-dependent receptor [Bacteroidales bacterium]|nr:TonB-dependent receptor [Bacteroidales bacterium]
MRKFLLLTIAVLLMVRLSAQTVDTTTIQIDEVPTVILSDSDFDDESSTSVNDASTLLHSSRDVFNSIAAFNFGSLRFRVRGNDSKYSDVMINGILMNDPETGRPVFANWGGLNDAMRNSVIVEGLGRTDAGFGGLGGLTSISTRASQYRKQISLSYAFSNRSYNHRVMASVGTGEIGKGWYLMAAASGRYAGEGYTEGTFYRAASYFLSVEKKINDKHSLDFTIFGAPSQRGGSAPVVQEAYDLVGTNYYNPFWGYQTIDDNGTQVKRNSRVSTYHQPFMNLTWYWTPNKKTSFNTTFYYFAGKAGQTSLEWGEAPDPRPDYYKNLPSYFKGHAHSTAEYQEQYDAWVNRDPSVTQIDWDAMYNANRNHLFTVENANGTPGNTVTGAASKYILAERHYDKMQTGNASYFKHEFTPNLIMAGGVSALISRTHYYESVNDLLGGDFYYDVNKYAENHENDEFQVDVNNPNHVALEGDIIGYNYLANRNYGKIWDQIDYLVGNFDLYFGLELTFTQIWRTGLFQSGSFADNSYGEDSKHNFFDPSLKAGVTYAINGRNHIVANMAMMYQAPQFRDIYVSPRTRHTLVGDKVGSERINAFDLGYQFRSPIFKFRLTGYYYTYRNLIWNRSFYCENVFQNTTTSANSYTSEFINFIMTGINQRSLGVELGAEYKVTPTITLQLAAANGIHVYDNNPVFSVYDDNNATAYIEDEIAYLKYYHVSTGPESAASLGIRYNDPKNWWVSMNANVLGNMYFDINPYNHTEFGMLHYAEGDIRIDDVLKQEPMKPAFTLDFYGGFSRRYKGYYFLFNLSVNNILNNKNTILFGYDQLRFNANNPDMFPSKYSYMYGTNFFISLTVRK